MDFAALNFDGPDVIYRQWRFFDASDASEASDAEEAEEERRQLRAERRELECERRQFEREQEEFLIRKRAEDRRLENERNLFEMKWKLLQGELEKLAAEKKQLEKQRSFYRYVGAHEKEERAAAGSRPAGELFFVGVRSEQALKKRYKDLIKIFHPDNLGGDTGTIQVINREYDRLKQRYR